MAEIKPFRALRFTDKAGNIASLTCPPYDIISEEQRQKFLCFYQIQVLSLKYHNKIMFLHYLLLLI